MQQAETAHSSRKSARSPGKTIENSGRLLIEGKRYRRLLLDRPAAATSPDGERWRTEWFRHCGAALPYHRGGLALCWSPGVNRDARLALLRQLRARPTLAGEVLGAGLAQRAQWNAAVAGAAA